MQKKYISTDKAPVPVGPYSQAVEVDNTLYVSGQIGMNPITKVIGAGDVAQETNQIMKNLWAILDAGGYSITDIVKCTIYITNMDDFDIVNATYGKYFDNDPPVRETVEVSALPKGAHVEISCLAVK